MKNFKRVLALGLSACMVTGLMTFPASAAEPTPSYSDVAPNAVYAEAVEALTAAEVMKGVGDGLFAPQMEVSRAQAITVLANLAKTNPVETDDFTDLEPNSWYSGYVGWAVQNGIVQGDGEGHFLPDALVTSEHLNLMLSRYAKSINKDITFYDTGASTVTRADLAQRLYGFIQEDLGDDDTPLASAPTQPEIRYVNRVVYRDGETVVIFVDKDGYYVNANQEYVNPENGETVTDPIQVPDWNKLPITPVDEAMMPAVVRLTGEGKYGFGSGYLLGYKDNGVYTFLNIKYGNAERFKHPTPNTRYGSASSPSFCMNMGPVAPQAVTNADAVKGFGNAAILTPSDSDMYSQEENCLNLNVWTDTVDSDAKRPVLVFMHGGGYTEGSSIEQKNYRGEYFTRFTSTQEAGGVVFVSVNARLNTLGYTSLEGIGGDPNCALADMVLALEWVQDNIKQFGGDPENVTIMGQSGGGGKVSALASSPKAYEEHLFSRVVNASGSSASATNRTSAQATARRNVDRVKSNEDFINWLRTEKAGETVAYDSHEETTTNYEHVDLVSGPASDEGTTTTVTTWKLPENTDRDNIWTNYMGWMWMPIDSNDFDEDGTVVGENLINALADGNTLVLRYPQLDEEGNEVTDEEGETVYEETPIELIVETTEVTEPAEPTEGPANKIPDKYLDTDENGNKTLKSNSNLYVSFYGSYQAVNASDIAADGSVRGNIVSYGLSNAIYERVITTTIVEGGTITIGNDCTFNELRAYAQSDAVTTADVFAYLQQCPYDHLPSLSGATFVADGVYFSTEGSFGNNTPSQNYTYYYGSCWGEMSMASSDGGVMQSNPSAFVSNIDMAAWEQQNYGTGRVGSLEEIKAEFEKVWPNHILYDLRAAGTGSFSGQASLAGRLQGDNKVYTYFNAYDYPMFGGLTVVHTQDLGLMFHSLEALPYQIHGDEENAFKVADAAATALADFCRNGVPTVNGEELPANTTNASENCTAIFDVESRIVQSGFNSELNRLLGRQ